EELDDGEAEADERHRGSHPRHERALDTQPGADPREVTLRGRLDLEPALLVGHRPNPSLFSGTGGAPRRSDITRRSSIIARVAAHRTDRMGCCRSVPGLRPGSPGGSVSAPFAFAPPPPADHGLLVSRRSLHCAAGGASALCTRPPDSRRAERWRQSPRALRFRRRAGRAPRGAAPSSTHPKLPNARRRSYRHRMSDPIWTGGCLCGAVRYVARGEPRIMGYCFCTDCRKASGSGFIPFIGVASDAVKITGTVITHTLRHEDG